MEGAVEWAMIGIFLNQGEICSAGSRIIIEESIKDKFVKRLAERANAITIGNPLENPDMGPLVSESHMNKVLDYIKKVLRRARLSYAAANAIRRASARTATLCVRLFLTTVPMI